MASRLRVGLLVDSQQIPSWQYTMLERLQNSHYAEVALIVTCRFSPGPRRSFFTRVATNERRFLYVLQSRLDAKLRPPNPDPFSPKDLSGLFSSTARLSVDLIEAGVPGYSVATDIEQIKSANLDVLLRLHSRPIAGDILTCAKFGVWSYQQGCDQKDGGTPPGYWEVMEGRPVTSSSLQVLSEGLEASRTLCRSFSQTDPLFVQRNNGRICWKMASYVPRSARTTVQVGSGARSSQPLPKPKSLWPPAQNRTAAYPAITK